jgi:hypothetical protein
MAILTGVDFNVEKGKVQPPTTTKHQGQQLFEWFQAQPESDQVIIRTICIRLTNEDEVSNYMSGDIGVPADAFEAAVWGPDAYYDLVRNPAGGAAGLIN